MSDQTIEERVRETLRAVEGPSGPVDLTGRGRLRGLRVEDGKVRFELALGPDEPSALVGAAREAVAGMDGVDAVRVELAAVAGGSDDRPDEDAREGRFLFWVFQEFLLSYCQL